MKRYKANKKYTLHEIADEVILFQLEQDSTNPESAIVFNEAGAIMWKNLLENNCTVDFLAELLCTNFDIDKITAVTDVEIYLQKCIDEGLIYELVEG